MIRRFSTIALALSAGTFLGAGACGTTVTETTNSPTNAKVARPADPTRMDDAAPSDVGFYATVPQKAVEAKVGDKVIAFVADEFGSGELKLVELTAVNGNTANLKEVIGSKTFNGVPGALIYPLPEQGSVKVGDAVNGFSSALYNKPGRIAAIEGNRILMKVSYTSGQVTELEANYVMPFVSGINPLAWVAYEDGDRLNMAIYLGENGDKALLVASGLASGGGKFLSIDKSKVKAVDLTSEVSAGEEVYLYSNIYGWQKGKVEAVKEPGIVYEVKRDEGNTKVGLEFFTHVAKSIS
jgi:hypothetical protein